MLNVISFETNPYVPHNQIKNEIEYEDFLRNKSVFSEKLFQQVASQIENVKQQNSKLLMVMVPVDHSNLIASIEDYRKKVSILEKAIDCTLELLKKETL